VTLSRSDKPGGCPLAIEVIAKRRYHYPRVQESNLEPGRNTVVITLPYVVRLDAREMNLLLSVSQRSRGELQRPRRRSEGLPCPLSVVIRVRDHDRKRRRCNYCTADVLQRQAPMN